ncbi:MAG: hypothetical protein JWN07_382 [Hyphomicrobiales bacterium]|nr:hypothetical protein [Hyphomicrobiales bacterium]
MTSRQAAYVLCGVLASCLPAAAQNVGDRLTPCNAYCRAWMGWDDVETQYLWDPEEMQESRRPAARPRAANRVRKQERVVTRPVVARPSAPAPARQPRVAARPAKPPVVVPKAVAARPTAPAPAPTPLPLAPPLPPAAVVAPPQQTAAIAEPPPKAPVPLAAPVQEAPPAPAPQQQQVATPAPLPPDDLTPEEAASALPEPAEEAPAERKVVASIPRPAAGPLGSPAEIREALGLTGATANNPAVISGEFVDAAVQLQPLPQAFKTLRPYYANLLYAVIGETAVLVYPETRRIVMTY